MGTEEFKAHKEHTFDAYCKRVLKNKAADLHRELTRQEQHETSLEDLLPVLENTKQYEDVYQLLRPIHTNLPAGSFYVSDPELEAALSQLLPKYRDVIYLYYFLGYTDKEIGCILNIHQKTVNSRRRRALNKLKERLGLSDGE